MQTGPHSLVRSQYWIRSFTNTMQGQPNIIIPQLINAFKQFFSCFGFPDSVLSDQGSQYESNEFLCFLNSFSIKKLRTNSYHPQGNGLCERFNGTIKKLMLSYLFMKFGQHYLSLNQSKSRPLLSFLGTYFNFLTMCTFRWWTQFNSFNV